MALGATRRQVLGMVMLQGLGPASVGAGLGVALAAAASRGLAMLLYGVSPTNSAVFAAVRVLLVVAALLATGLPARRAATANPVDALRRE